MADKSIVNSGFDFSPELTAIRQYRIVGQKADIKTDQGEDQKTKSRNDLEKSGRNQHFLHSKNRHKKTRQTQVWRVSLFLIPYS